MESTVNSKEAAVAGVTSGLMSLGEEVTWEATHFGVRQRLTSRITAFEKPNHFRDSQVRGIFERFDHDHDFSVIDETTTRMVDTFDYQSPLGWLGIVADKLFLERYMRALLQNRNAVIKAKAEGTS